MICDICNHFCDLSDNETGKCSVISNKNSTLTNLYEGNFSIISVDKIEKRPLFHFSPDMKLLSVGFLGCQMSCTFCQNFSVSQSVTAKTKKISPSSLVDLCIEKKAEGICFTYNEPSLYYDFIHNVYDVICDRGACLPIIIKTNGFASERVMKILSHVSSAINVDIKGTEDDYSSICGARLLPVLENIESIVNDTHIEISYIVMPQSVKNNEFHKKISSWIGSLSKNIPIHILYCYPVHKMTDYYEIEDLLEIIDIFRKNINYVYVSNVYHSDFLKYRNTYCPYCSKQIANRENGVKIYDLSCCGQAIIKKVRI